MNFPTCSDLALPEHWTIFLYFPTCWDCPCQHYPNSGKILCTFPPVWIFPVSITQTLRLSCTLPPVWIFPVSITQTMTTSVNFPTSSEFAMSALPKPWKLPCTFSPPRNLPCQHYPNHDSFCLLSHLLGFFPVIITRNPENFLVLSHLLGIVPVSITWTLETFLYFPTS